MSGVTICGQKMRSTQTHITKKGNKMGTKKFFLNEKILKFTTKKCQYRKILQHKSLNKEQPKANYNSTKTQGTKNPRNIPEGEESQVKNRRKWLSWQRHGRANWLNTHKGQLQIGHRWTQKKGRKPHKVRKCKVEQDISGKNFKIKQETTKHKHEKIHIKATLCRNQNFVWFGVPHGFWVQQHCCKSQVCDKLSDVM